MIQFGLLTFMAEINAMPCPPDEFQIIISAMDKVYYSEGALQLLIEPLIRRYINEYEYIIDERNYDQSTFIQFIRHHKPKTKRQKSVHDLILQKMNHN